MKNILNYYYNLDVDNIKLLNKNLSCFYIDYSEFYFVKYQRPINDLIDIYTLINTQKNKYHIIIKNRYGNIYTNYNKENYVLLKVNSAPHEEVDLLSIIKNNRIVQNIGSLNRSNWSDLWSEKIDYIEYQIIERGKDYKIIDETIDYYIGMAENAISYFNNIEKKNNNLYISSKRILFPNINLNYYNPLNIILDFKVRDVAEYIKSYFFSGYNIKNDLLNIINSNSLDEKDYNLLFIRLLYPSYYFDLIEKILDESYDEDMVLKYVNLANDYEDFLIWFYHLVSKKYKLIKIDWLIKKEL